MYSDEVLKGAFKIVNELLSEATARITQLEKHIHYPHAESEQERGGREQLAHVAMKEAAAKAQAMRETSPGVKVSPSYIDKAQGNSCRIDGYHDAKAQPEPLQSHAQMQANQAANSVPMRADTEAILALTKFAKRLLNPEDLGHAVTYEVRQAARRALGLPEAKEYDL